MDVDVAATEDGDAKSYLCHGPLARASGLGFRVWGLGFGVQGGV